MASHRLPESRVKDLRAVLHRQIARALDDETVQDALRQCVDDVASEASGPVDKDRLLQVLDERGLVNDVLQRSIAANEASTSTRAQASYSMGKSPVVLQK